MRRLINILIVLLIIINTTGCSLERKEKDINKSDIDYTVVEDADVPEEFMKIINDKKNRPFKITFSDKNNLYIAIGYGEQPTGGYSISVEEIYQTQEYIMVKTHFSGPVKNEKVSQVISYPYIVIMVENTDKTIKFQ